MLLFKIHLNLIRPSSIKPKSISSWTNPLSLISFHPIRKLGQVWDTISPQHNWLNFAKKVNNKSRNFSICVDGKTALHWLLGQTRSVSIRYLQRCRRSWHVSSFTWINAPQRTNINWFKFALVLHTHTHTYTVYFYICYSADCASGPWRVRIFLAINCQ